MASNAHSIRPLQSTSTDRFLVAANPSDYQRIRDVLAAADYTDKGITQRLGTDTLNRLGERKLPVLLRRISGKTPLDTLIQLFILGEPADVAAASSAFAPMTVDEWVNIGLVSRNGTLVQPALQLRCFQSMVIAFDFIRRGPGGLPKDYVMGVSPSSLVLATMTPRRPIRSALDLGTGSGIQSFMAAAHSEHVVSIGCNARALAVSRFNAHLNGISNIEFRDGDMFGPVAGETFDLIVTNPPFIISPENRHLFLNSGLDGDDICRRIVREAPAFLKEGGYCVLNVNWAVVEGEDWRARLASWFKGNKCDGLVILQGIQDLGEYAAGLIEVGTNDQAEYVRHFNEWMDYYGAHRMTGIGQGVIIMRRAFGRRNWFAVDGPPQNVAYPSGSDVERLFELRTFLHLLSSHSDLLNQSLKLAPNVRLEQTLGIEDGAWRQLSGRIYRVGGLEFSGSLDGQSAAALAQFDGRRTLRECLMQVADMLKEDPSAFFPGALALVRRMIEQGFILPADF
jgi:SAM-dependent methyltransferase